MIKLLVGNMYDSRGIFVSFVETKTYNLLGFDNIVKIKRNKS
jgi:hypothetical protein